MVSGSEVQGFGAERFLERLAPLIVQAAPRRCGRANRALIRFSCRVMLHTPCITYQQIDYILRTSGVVFISPGVLLRSRQNIVDSLPGVVSIEPNALDLQRIY